MTKTIFLLGLTLALTFSYSNGFSQGTNEDYQRAARLENDIKDKVLHSASDIQWTKSDHRFCYSILSPSGKEYLLIDAKNKTKKPAFDYKQLAEALHQATGQSPQPNNLPLTALKLSPNGEFTFSAYDKNWVYHPQSTSLKEDTTTRRTINPFRNNPNDNAKVEVSSPDGKWLAFIREYNVYIRSTQSKEEYQLSFDGSPGAYYASEIIWAPDSKKFTTNKVRPGQERKLYLLESSPIDQLQPKLHSRNYLKPGDALAQKLPSLFLVDEKKQLSVPASLISNQYSLLGFKWRKDSRSFTFEYNQRGHQKFQVFEMDAVTGNVNLLIEEVSKTFFPYNSIYGKKIRHDVNDGKEIIWASERDGWNHLYLYDGLSGKVKNQITKGDWVVRNVVHVDDASRTLIFEGSGRVEGQDPYFVQLYKINFDGSNLKQLTSENANHSAVFSDDYQLFVDTYSRVDQAPVSVLRNSQNGEVVMELEKADIKGLLATGWNYPEIYSAKGRDGKTDIWGIIVKPSNFDPKKKYPVIEYIYAGPHNSFVPKSFTPDPTGRLVALSELGFIVVQIDGMGTSNRSKAFHDVTYKNLKDSGFPDRIAWIKSATSEKPYMDLERVGIYGYSSGGQSSAGAVLFHPEFYKVAVSTSGCHDNRMDKIWWNEQWMGYPIGPHYAASSNIENASKLRGRLMLIVAEMDENVDPATTFQFADALIKNKKDFEFVILPGMGHNSGGEYGESKRRDFLVKHLLKVDPPVWAMQDPL